MDPDQVIEDYNENADDAVEASEHVEAGGTGDAGDAGGNGDAGGTGDAGDTGGNGEDGEDGESGDDDSQLETFEDEDILMEPSHWLGPSTTNWKRVYTGHGTDEISLVKGRLWDALEAENQAEAAILTQRLRHLRARTVVRALQDESRQNTDDVDFTDDTFDTLVSHMVYRENGGGEDPSSYMRHPYQYLCRRVDSNHRINLPIRYMTAETPGEGKNEAARIVHELTTLWRTAGEFILPKRPRQGQAEAFFIEEMARLVQYTEGLARDESPSTGSALVGYEGAQELNLKYTGDGGRVGVRFMVGYPNLSTRGPPLYPHAYIAKLALRQIGTEAAGVFVHVHLVDAGAHHFLFLAQYSKAVIPVSIGVGTIDQWGNDSAAVRRFNLVHPRIFSDAF